MFTKPLVPESFTVYTSESPIKKPYKLFKEICNSSWNSRGLAWSLLKRDIAVKYRQTILGIFWAFVPPVITGLLFIMLNKANIININFINYMPYPVFVFCGTVLWSLFTDSFNAPLKIVESNKSMLVKINFHREALIITAFGQVWLDFAIRLCILFVIILAYQIPLNILGGFFFILATIVLSLLGFTLGILIIPLGILYKDISSGLPTLLSLWFFITPIVYPIPSSGHLRKLFQFNPVSPILNGARDLLILGNISDYLPFIIISFFTFIGIFIVLIIYKVTLPILIERM